MHISVIYYDFPYTNAIRYAIVLIQVYIRSFRNV